MLKTIPAVIRFMEASLLRKPEGSPAQALEAKSFYSTPGAMTATRTRRRIGLSRPRY
jgi:hypothetical protein